MSKAIAIIGPGFAANEKNYGLCKTLVKQLYEPGDLFVSTGLAEHVDWYAQVIAKAIGATLVIHYRDDSELNYLDRANCLVNDADIIVTTQETDKRTKYIIQKAKEANKTVLQIGKTFSPQTKLKKTKKAPVAAS